MQEKLLSPKGFVAEDVGSGIMKELQNTECVRHHSGMKGTSFSLVAIY
jgi:hypothetical protein